MDLTGSILDSTAPLSAGLYGSAAGGVGSSFVDTALEMSYLLPRFLISIVARMGADLGSTIGID